MLISPHHYQPGDVLEVRMADDEQPRRYLVLSATPHPIAAGAYTYDVLIDPEDESRPQ